MGSSIENETLNIKQDVDVWSLGAVLSEVTTWVVCDWETVEEYRWRRRTEVKRTCRFNEDADCFHDGKDEVLDCVDQHHNELAQNVQSRDYVTREVLNMIKNDMLRPSYHINARRTAQYLCQRVDLIVEAAQQPLAKMHPDNSLGPVSGPVLIPPDPPGHRPSRRLTPAQPPYQPSPLPGGSFTINGLPRIITQDYEHSPFRQTQLVKDETANNLEPTMSTPPHRPSSRYSHRSAPTVFKGQDEDPFYNPLTDFTGGTSVGGSGHGISNYENQNLPVPGPSPIRPERSSKSPREDLRMQRYSKQESLQHQKSLPVWQVEDALRWKRIKKDPMNYEHINIPDVNGDLEKLKGRDHVRTLSSTMCIR